MTRSIATSRLLAASFACLLPAVGFAREAGSTIRISDAWSRPAITGRPGVVYLTATDTGAPDEITGASTPVAESAGLHQSTDAGGMMRMQPVSSIRVARGEPAVLAPGGYHIMLMGLKQPLRPGQTFPLTLTFAHAAPVIATVTVRKFGIAASGDGHMMPEH